MHGKRVSGAQFDGTPLDEALEQAVKVRIIEGFSSEGAPGQHDVRSDDGRRRGDARRGHGLQRRLVAGATIPPYVPVHLQPIDEFDLAIRNQTTWIQGMPGEDRVCGGCHESRTSPNLPGGQQLTTAAGRGPENFMIAGRRAASSTRGTAPTTPANANEIQTILNAKCVSCHNETTNGNAAQTFYTVTMTDARHGATPTAYQIPRLDLSARPITVTYDRETKPWPASYVSLFYPAALEMEMDERRGHRHGSAEVGRAERRAQQRRCSRS